MNLALVVHTVNVTPRWIPVDRPSPFGTREWFQEWDSRHMIPRGRMIEQLVLRQGRIQP